MSPRRTTYGFTLTELAIVLLIVGLLMVSLMYTLSAQTESRDFTTTKRQLDEARELLLAYAVVNGRLPCPATATSNGAESIASAAATGTGGTCSVNYNGFLPAATIGFSRTDSGGFGLDAWGNRIRYAVSKTSEPHFTSNSAILANWTTVTPADLVICKHLTAANATTCGGASNQVVTNGTAVALVWSQGKNYLTTAGTAGESMDERTNYDGFAAFVSRAPSPPGSSDGEFDDQLEWIPVGVLYGRLIAAGKLP